MEDPGYGSGRLIFRAGRDHNPEVTGSNPVPATAGEAVTIIRGGLSFIRRRALRGRISDRGDDVL